jgi:D-amino-acid dehydrogenase
MPIIGPAPRHKNLWLAFAHAHMGFTMGPITGKIISSYVADCDQPLPVNAYSPDRYI